MRRFTKHRRALRSARSGLPSDRSIRIARTEVVGAQTLLMLPTALHANGRRDHDPTVGRHIQVDPTGLSAGINPYLYANGSPAIYTDPTGEIGLLGAGIGAAVDAALQSPQLGFQGAKTVTNHVVSGSLSCECGGNAL